MPKLTKSSFGTTPDRFRAQVVLALEAEASPVNKRRYAALVLAAILLIAIACTAAAAILLRRTPEAEAVSQAKAALFEKYGLTAEALGLFHEHVERTPGGFSVAYVPFTSAGRIGCYHVDVPAKSTPTAYWTYDIVATGGLTENAEAGPWGAAQIEALLALKAAYEERREGMIRTLGPIEGWSIEARAALDAMLLDSPYRWQEGNLHILPADGDIAEAEAYALAAEAVQARYGIPEDTLSGFTRTANYVLTPGIGAPRYNVFLADATAEAPQNGLGAFWVTITPDGTVTDCRWTVAPENRTLPEGPLAAYEDAVREYVESGALEAIAGDAARQQVAIRIAEAGFEALLGGAQYAAPAADALPRQDAIAIAEKALEARYGLTDALRAAFDESLLHVLHEGAPVWRMRLSPNGAAQGDPLFAEALGTYHLDIDAGTGAIATIYWSNEGMAASPDATESTWGAEPAWDASILPYYLALAPELATAQEAIAAARDEDAAPALRLLLSAEYHQLLRDAGFSRALFDAGYPQAGEIPLAEAESIAKAVLLEDYGVTEADLAVLTIAASYSVEDPENPVWRISLYPEDPALERNFYVGLDGRTGAVIESLQSLLFP